MLFFVRARSIEPHDIVPFLLPDGGSLARFADILFMCPRRRQLGPGADVLMVRQCRSAGIRDGILFLSGNAKSIQESFARVLLFL